MATFEGHWAKVLNFEHLEKPVKAHLKNVYAAFAISMLAATAGAYVHMFTNLMQAGLLTLIGSIALLVLLGTTPHSRDTEKKRLGYLVGFTFLSGMALGPLMDIVMHIDPSIIPTAFLGTCLIFVCFSMAVLLTDNRKLIFLGGTLLSGLSMLFMMSLLNIFFRSNLVYQVELYLGFLIMCGFVLYDTQLIVEKRRRGDDDYIWHCIDLFMDFIQIFRRLMIILANKENDKKKRK